MGLGYLFLAFALAAGVAKGYCGKKTSGFTKDTRDAVFVSLIRFLLCIGVGLVIVAAGGHLKFLIPDTYTLIFSLMSGIFTSLFVVTWLISVRSVSYMLVDIFLTFGVIVTIVLSSVFFPDGHIKLSQLLGFGVTVAGILIMCSYNNSNTPRAKLDIKYFLLLIGCALSSGLADFSQKCFAEYRKSAPESQADAFPASVFNLYTYVFSAIVLVAVLLFMKKDASKNQHKLSFSPKIFMYIFIMAACLFANSFFKTLAAENLAPIYLYPLQQGGALMLSTIMSAVLLKEKPTVKSIIGTVITFCGLLIINLI